MLENEFEFKMDDESDAEREEFRDQADEGNSTIRIENVLSLVENGSHTERRGLWARPATNTSTSELKFHQNLQSPASSTRYYVRVEEVRNDTLVSSEGVFIHQKAMFSAMTQTDQNCTLDSSSQTYRKVLVTRWTQTDIDPDYKEKLKKRKAKLGIAKVPKVKDKRCFKKNSRQIRTKHCCIYCKKVMYRLGRHLQLVHRNEKDVARIFALPQSMKRKALVALARRGDYYYNVKVLASKKGKLIIARKPNKRDRKKYSYSDYACCSNCRAFMRKVTLKVHHKQCCSIKNSKPEESDEGGHFEIKVEPSDSLDEEMEADYIYGKTSHSVADGQNGETNEISVKEIKENDGNDHDSILYGILSQLPNEQSCSESASALSKCKSLEITDTVNEKGNYKRKRIEHCCIYCKKVMNKLGRHLQLMHRNEKDVASIFALPPSLKRKALIVLARKGDYYHNMKVLASKKGKLIVAREPNKRDRKKYSYNDYTCCPNCRAFLLKKTLNFHQKQCCSVANLKLDSDEEEHFEIKVEQSDSLDEEMETDYVYGKTGHSVADGQNGEANESSVNEIMENGGSDNNSILDGILSQLSNEKSFCESAFTIGKCRTLESTDAVKEKKNSRVSRTKHCCIYCKKVMNKLGRHLQRMHRNEKDVASIFALPPSLKRKALIVLARKGDYSHNMKVLASKKGKLIVAREPNKRDGKKYSYSDYACCPHCLAFMRKTTLNIHQKQCCSEEEDHIEIKIEYSDNLEDADVELLPKDGISELFKENTNLEKPNGKSHCCVYCMKIVKNISMHFELKHACEEEVTRLMDIDKGLLRNRGLLALARKGDYCHNLRVLASEKGKLILAKAPKDYNSKKYSYSDFACCSHCLGFMSKRFLNCHEKRCFLNPKNSANSHEKTLSENEISRKGVHQENITSSSNAKTTRTTLDLDSLGREGRVTHGHRRWSLPEREAVMSFYRDHMKKGILPKKEDAIKCKEQFDVLSSRSWKDIKYLIYNHMQRKQKTLDRQTETPLDSGDGHLGTTDGEEETGEVTSDKSEDPVAMNETEESFMEVKEYNINDIPSETAEDINNPGVKFITSTDEENGEVTWDDSRNLRTNESERSQTDGKENNMIMQSLSNHKKPWSSDEQEAIAEFYGKHIKEKKVPRKEDAEECLKQYPVFVNRTWRDVKFYVHNQILKLKRNK